MTAPMIGNYGVNSEDGESERPQIAGVVVRELSRGYSNWRADGDLGAWLARANVPILEGIDTRQLTRRLRSEGVVNGVIAPGESITDEARAALEACPSMEGLDLASVVTTKEPYEWGSPNAKSHIVAYDFGIKRNILRLFEENDCRVTVVPATTSAEETLELRPDGVFFSNGPGDPAAVSYAPGTMRKIADAKVPIFGICLGHQILALALGGKTEKLDRGHRGANHPVKDLATGKVEITSQNHGFAVIPESLPKNVEVSHVSLFDGTNEGLRCTDKPAFSVQYHPEASPGPQDSHYLFDRFVEMMKKHG
jgi:carbamoyl-phosphate synthase small subunit